jgi:6-phospho-beta-glucosidase
VQDKLFALYRDPNLNEKPKQLEMRGGAYYSTVATMLMEALCSRQGLEMLCAPQWKRRARAG